MPIIRQESLFDIQDLYDLEPTRRFEAIFSTLTIEPVLATVSKRSIYGAPTKLNYAAMIYALVARIVERIPTIKDLVKRLRHDFMFHLECGFLFSDQIPSEASFSRFTQKLSESNVLETVQETLLLQAIQENFITDDVVSIDATHFESRDQATSQEKKPKPEPKKRGRKPKVEQEAFQKEKQEQENQKNIYEKTIEDQLDVSLETLRTEIPLRPNWGIKKNSEGKNTFWFGFKAHLAVGTKSQYILQSLMSSASLHDRKAAIPLLKGIQERLSSLTIQYGTLDAGYDYEAIYAQFHRMKAKAIIAYNKRNEGELIGFDEHFAPTCVREHSYRYDSFDEKYQTLKYTKPNECKTCPLAHDSLCQKVYKIKMETDIRKYNAPGRGSEAWKKLYNQRSAVERVNAYLKEFFQLKNVRYRTGKRAKIHFDLVTLVYNASKLAVDRINQKMKEMKQAA
ncbi:IS5/IS1182 family transposase [Bacillus thuringiensis]|uniref:transposase n=1 Tax=Bacillus tropicus TaxID=2026188 RepID=UPI000B453A10|nr:transposase [Bacillus tropicus]OTX77453.1 IS5/IS1182 family transposase [Bacillus thuringiensis serovar chanpaisis]PNK22124.1 IS5/IS1182 family transposase [Bacillus thuringiensis]MED3038018.1 transposase [Bacillus tropicus]OTX80257.1 IS5/IS1182 family transposase [Bacillus thuringiensis serovar chanpaisis]OTX80259.1 IS5/IS1182 family transposase [Bacillus thuringiensis serovar chanpaisis]